MEFHPPCFESGVRGDRPATKFRPRNSEGIIEKDRASRSATLPVRSSAVLILGCAELQSLIGRVSAPCGCGFDNPPSGLIRRPHACSVILAVQFVSTGVLLKARPKRGGGRSWLAEINEHLNAAPIRR